ncbi:hypothetical protein [Streptomyces sp. HNM0574]|uniref:hypothetical protein n=1 Tax=Streptomyces sp. HNM0574 TaxID=2714954 RepID=UPI001F10C4B3|nr:hypothetical protein [Streptomyces sp. HNM0574]
MAGFRALAQQVRDPGRAPSQRRRALRKCLERFAPYGHRATWQHLCSRTGIHPEDRDPDPALLLAALEELEEARAVWLAYEAEVAARRRREKRAGVRQPTALDEWHRLTWGGRSLLRCDPAAPPTPRLADVLRRMIAAVNYGTDRATGHHDSRLGRGDAPGPRPVRESRGGFDGPATAGDGRTGAKPAGATATARTAAAPAPQSRAGARGQLGGEDRGRGANPLRGLRAGQGAVVTTQT